MPCQVNPGCGESTSNQVTGKNIVCHYNRSLLMSLKFDFKAERNAPAK